MKISKRADGRWRCRVRLPGPPGTYNYQEVMGRTKSECREKTMELIAELEAGTWIPQNSTRLKDYARIWLDNYTSNLAQNTRRNYQGDLRNHIIPALGSFQLQELSRPLIQDFVQKLTEKGLSPKSVRNITQELGRILSDAVKDGLIKENPAREVILPKKKKKEIKPLTRDEAKTLLLYMGDKIYGDILSFILLTGVWCNEATGLCWDCVDEIGRTITIKRQKIRNRQDFSPPKHGKIRTIPLADSVATILSRHTENKASGGPVFLNRNNRIMDSRKLLTYIKKYAKASIGRNDVTVHTLRHTFASIMLSEGVDLRTVQDLLGHSSSQITFEIYVHAMPAQIAKSAEIADSLGRNLGH